MKRLGSFVLIGCVALLAASFAFADGGGGKGGQGNQGDKSDKQGSCHTVSLKGTAPATSFTVTVDKANRAGRDLKTATVTFAGNVSINAQMCSSGDSGSAPSGSTPSGATLKLRNLKVGKASSDG